MGFGYGAENVYTVKKTTANKGSDKWRRLRIQEQAETDGYTGEDGKPTSSLHPLPRHHQLLVETGMVQSGGEFHGIFMTTSLEALQQRS